MQNIEFIKYEPTPGERYIGIATIKYFSKIILRYKIVPTKDGSSFFSACASYKLPGNDDQYIPCFTLDSVSEKEEIEGFIRSNVKKYLNGKSAPQSSSDEIPF